MKLVTMRKTFFVLCILCIFITLWYLSGSIFQDLTIDGEKAYALLKDDGIDVNGNLGVLLNISDSSYTTQRIKERGTEEYKIVHNRPKVTKTLYPLTIDSPYLINNPYICTNVTNLKVMIFVHSATYHFQSRRSIRETWANKKLFTNFNIRILFLFGLTKNKRIQKSIENESKEYGDIVQGNFLDSYHNLTQKGVLSFRWLSEHCMNAQMVLKVDDDMFINIFILIENFYPKLKSKERHILCQQRGKGSSPIARGQRKWQVEDDEFKGYSHYPIDYCNGYVVLISMDIIRSLYRASYLTPFFWVDDVYLFGLLPMMVGHVTYENIRYNMTLFSDVGLKCYIEKKKCGYLAVKAKSGRRVDQLWHSALRQISPQMRTEVNVNYSF